MAKNAKNAKEDEVSEDANDVQNENKTDESSSLGSQSNSPSRIVFHVSNKNTPEGKSTRVFDKSVGSDFLEKADEFEKANTHKKITLDKNDTEYQEHKKEVEDHNRSIAHPIIHKHVE